MANSKPYFANKKPLEQVLTFPVFCLYLCLVCQLLVFDSWSTVTFEKIKVTVKLDVHFIAASQISLLNFSIAVLV